MNLTSVVDLIPILHTGQVQADVDDLVQHIKSTHDKVRAQIEESNASYKVAADQYHCRVVFEKGDDVWVYLQKEHFPIVAYHKLRQRKIGLYVLK